MAKKNQNYGKQENVDELEHRISVLTYNANNYKSGNKNDKIVAKLINDKVKDTWVKQKDELETQL